MEITKEWIAQQRALCNAATPGPWESKHYGRYEDHDECCIALTDDSIEPSKYENADFIAAARTALPAALDALEAAQKEIERMEQQRDLAYDAGFDASASYYSGKWTLLSEKIAHLTAELAAEKKRADALAPAMEDMKQALCCGGARELSAACSELWRIWDQNAPSGAESEGVDE